MRPSLKLLLVAQSHHQRIACPSLSGLPSPKTPAPTRFLLRVTGPYDNTELRQCSVSRLDGPYSSFIHCKSLGDHRGYACTTFNICMAETGYECKTQTREANWWVSKFPRQRVVSVSTALFCAR